MCNCANQLLSQSENVLENKETLPTWKFQTAIFHFHKAQSTVIELDKSEKKEKLNSIRILDNSVD